MKPVLPFEPISTETFPEGNTWVGQVKWDGVRVLTYYDGHEVKLFNRRLNERTFHYPELSTINNYCSAKSVILDGEIIALKDGKPSFYEVMKRDGLKKLSQIDTLKNKLPITYMIFDVLYFDNQWVTSSALSERQRILTEIIKPTEHVQLVENFCDAKALFDAIKVQDMEGIVIKDLSGTYLINGKDERWQKKKVARDLIAVVGGVTTKDSTVNSLLLGLFDEQGQLWYIGHSGTGHLTQKDWRNLTEGIRPIIQTAMPFVNTPRRSKGTIWLKPVITVKIKYAEWSAGNSLRQPSIQGFVQIPPGSCTFH